MSSDVPFAMRSLVPNSSMSAGTTTMPPPTPMSPATVPVATPSTTSPEIVKTLSGRPASREGTTMNRLTITTARNAMKLQRSTVSETRGSSHVPICAPTTAPAARSRPGIQATESLRAYEITPTDAIGMIAASEVPAARRWLRASTSTRSGTITVPPPTPNRPDSRPASRPMPRQVRMYFAPRGCPAAGCAEPGVSVSGMRPILPLPGAAHRPRPGRRPAARRRSGRVRRRCGRPRGTRPRRRSAAD